MNAVRQKAEDIINFIKASRDFENLKGFYKENIKKYKKMPCSSLKQDVVDNDLKAFDDITNIDDKKLADNIRIFLNYAYNVAGFFKATDKTVDKLKKEFEKIKK